jgi:hypothetical protein
MSTENQIQDDIEQGVLGFSDVPCVINEEMRVTARDNSLALDDMLTRITLGLDFVVRLRDLSH